jgi:hypothetical protein
MDRLWRLLLTATLCGLAVHAQQPARADARVRIEQISGGTILVRDVTGDYSQHPQVFQALMSVRDKQYVGVGDCFGVYPVDPDAVASPQDLKWRVGVRVRPPTAAAPLATPVAPYKLESMPDVEAAVLETNVKNAGVDGLAITRWILEHGYVQVGPTRMEYLSHVGELMLIPTKIIVPVRKRSRALVLPRA